MATIGNKAMARLNGQVISLEISNGMGAGGFDSGNGYRDHLVAVKDVEYLNLDGIPYAEAVLGWSDSPPITTRTNLPSAATSKQHYINTLGMKFVPVPITGGPTGGQRVLFSIWDTRVQDYEVFAKETKRGRRKVEFAQEGTHPVVSVTWDDASAFCAWLTQRERAAGRLGATENYRLPSDHEWSCAVGIGEREDAAKLPSEKDRKITDVFPWGTQWPPPAGAGNYAGEEVRSVLAAGTFLMKIPGVVEGYHDGFVNTSPVGSFAANRYGLYDMSGNVWQWCEDWYDNKQSRRVFRGASLTDSPRDSLLSSMRHPIDPGWQDANRGFRCVLAAASPAVSPSPAPQVSKSSPTPATATKDAPFVNTLGMKFVPVPGTKVLFSIWETRVKDYAEFAKEISVSGFWKGSKRYGLPIDDGPEHPVSVVSWENANSFCQWLTEKETAAGKLPKGMRYRLPTDLEWSRAVGAPHGIGEHAQRTPCERRWRRLSVGRQMAAHRQCGQLRGRVISRKISEREA